MTGAPGSQPGAAPRIRAVGNDCIFVGTLVRSIMVGILPDEQGVTQRVQFSVSLELSADAQPDGDEPAVSYVDIVKAIDTTTAGQQVPLLEQLGERIAARLLANELVLSADITMEKLDRLAGAGTFGVRMVRERAS